MPSFLKQRMHPILNYNVLYFEKSITVRIILEDIRIQYLQLPSYLNSFIKGVYHL